MEGEKENKENKRRPNFTDEELRAIINGVGKRLKILNGKFSPTLTNEKKNAAWKEVTEEVNACSPYLRTVVEVKKKYKAYKSGAKKDVSNYNRQVTQTGKGGAPPTMPNELNQMVVNLIPAVAMQGIPGGIEVGGDIGLDAHIQEDLTNGFQPKTPPPLFQILNAEDIEVVPMVEMATIATQTTMTGESASSAVVSQGERMLEAVEAIQSSLAAQLHNSTIIMERQTRNETIMLDIVKLLIDLVNK